MSEPDDRSDADLLSAHVAGDPDAFGEIARRHRDRLWAVALRTTGDREEAADAVQDALISAFRRAESFRGDARVTTWLHRIVVNACLDRMRRKRAKQTDPLADDERLGDPTAASRHQDEAELGERRADVMAALRQLSHDQRAALVLVDMEGYTVEEAAAILDCAPGTVKSRCSRGRARLVPLLTAYRRNQRPDSGVEPASGDDASETRQAPPPPSSPIPASEESPS